MDEQNLSSTRIPAEISHVDIDEEDRVGCKTFPAPRGEEEVMVDPRYGLDWGATREDVGLKATL